MAAPAEPAPVDPSPADPVAALRVVAAATAAAIGLDRALVAELGTALPLLAPDPSAAGVPGAGGSLDPQDDAGDPGRLGRVHEALLDDEHRRRRGVHYTPTAVAAVLVGLVLDPLLDVGSSAGGGVPAVCDPACGGGAFLLAAADRLRRAGVAPVDAVGALHGLDLDPLAVEVSRTAVCLWAARSGVAGAPLTELATSLGERIRTGDALRDVWPGEGRLRAVVGNPPFAGQLARGTARDPESAERARALLGTAAGYADTAGLFLVRAVASAPGGRVGLLQPLSFLGARDAGAVRRRLLEGAVLEQVWLAGGRVFGAAVDVCAPVLRCGDGLIAPPAAAEGSVAVRTGLDGALVASVPDQHLAAAGTWAPVAARAGGVPAVDLPGAGTLGEHAHATAGFRDEFYALAPFVVDVGAPTDDGDRPPPLPAGHARLVTAGLVEPAHTTWGSRPTRLAGRRLSAPAVDLRALRDRAAAPDGDRRLAAWADARVRPKVVVATQTAVVEAAVDEDGSWWSSVPVISVVPDEEDPSVAQLWRLAAALVAPPVSAWVAERTAGTALAARALRVSARLVAQVPLPVDAARWSEGADLLRRVPGAVAGERPALLLAAGRVLTEAHGLRGREAAAVVRWWAARAGCA